MKNLKRRNNSLKEDNPSLCEEWDCGKNGDLKPDDFSPRSKSKIWWKCKSGHGWSATISDRNSTKRKRGCPYCAGKRVCKENSLGYKFPSLINEWSDKNSLSPFDYTHGSHKKVLWKCDKGHEWESQIINRVLGRKCPYCCPTNKKVCSDNSLLALNPDLSKEWNFTKNEGLTPNGFTVNSKKKVWWKCSVCGNEWQSSIGNRNNLGNGCPFCQGVLLKDGTHCDSIVEAYLYLKYKSEGKEFLLHVKYGSGLGNSRCDFFFPKENKYVEATGFHKGSMNYYFYLRNIVRKKKWVENAGAVFEFVQIFPHKIITKIVLENTKDAP